MAELTAVETESLLKALEAIDIEEFFSFLHYNRLEHLWREFLLKIDPPEVFQPWLLNVRAQALQLAAQQLKEDHTLRKIHEVFEAASIPYFIFKGANLRHIIYQNKTTRSSCDIDIFVPEEKKLDAVKCLSKEGYKLFAEDQNVSFEVSMVKNNISIDLHWYFLRQGRTRMDMSNYLFANREQFSTGLWGLNHSASLYVMLVHPVFSKHLASPSSMLIHMVDLWRLLEHEKTDLQGTFNMLDQSGMKTAAWCSLYLLNKLTGLEKPTRLAEQIQPGKLRRKYIEYWINNDLIRYFFTSSLPFRNLFSLTLQDQPRDVIRAVSALKKTLNLSAQQMKDVEATVREFKTAQK